MPRVIHSLQITYTSNGLSYLIAPLNRAGQSPLVFPCPPKQRAIDLRVGDAFNFKGDRLTVHAIEAFRDSTWPSQPEAIDGYLVRD